MNKLERFLEDSILLYLIVTKIMQFFGLIKIFEYIGLYNEFFDFVDIIVSMTGLAYVFYKASLSEIFFGEKNKFFDISVIFLYFLLIINKFIEFSRIIAIEGICNSSNRFLSPFICYLASTEGQNLESFGFFFGTFGIILLSIYATYKINIFDKSILNALHENNKTKKILKFISAFFIILGFYLIFFNFISEWFTRVLDAPIILIAIFLYSFKFHGKISDAEHILYKVGEIVEDLINNFINLFHDKKTIFFGISIILVFHLISDLAAFIIPYNLGLDSPYDIEDIDKATHKNFFEIYQEDIKNIESRDNSDKPKNEIMLFLIIIGYILNTIGTLYLMFFPLFIWYVVYNNNLSKKQLVFPNFLIALFFACFVFMKFLPTYKITSLYSNNLIGTDIQTISILETGNSILNFFIFSLIIFLVVFFVCNLPMMKDILFFLMTLICIGFFGIYIYYYFLSLLSFYEIQIKFFLDTFNYYNAFMYIIFLMILSMFYIGSYLSFIISIFKES